MKMNVPNKITMARILLIPFIMLFYLASFMPKGYGKLIALILFIVASVTDFLDGYIARKYNLITDFGKLADTIADKMLTFVAIFMFMVDGIIPTPYGVIFASIVLCRDFIVLGIKSLVSTKGGVVGSEKIGKVKFFVSTITYPFGFLLAILLAFGVVGALITVIQVVFYILLAVTFVLTIYSLIDYIIKYRYVFDKF